MKKLYKSSSDKVFLGVLGGLGKVLSIEPIILRLIYIVFALRSPIKLLILYIIAGIIIPSDIDVVHSEDSPSLSRGNTVMFVGIVLILIGIYLLLQNFLPEFNLSIMPQIRAIFRGMVQFWPILLIGLGIYIIFNQRKQK